MSLLAAAATTVILVVASPAAASAEGPAHDPRGADRGGSSVHESSRERPGKEDEKGKKVRAGSGRSEGAEDRPREAPGRSDRGRRSAAPGGPDGSGPAAHGRDRTPPVAERGAAPRAPAPPPEPTPAPDEPSPTAPAPSEPAPTEPAPEVPPATSPDPEPAPTATAPTPPAPPAPAPPATPIATEAIRARVAAPDVGPTSDERNTAPSPFGLLRRTMRTATEAAGAAVASSLEESTASAARRLNDGLANVSSAPELPVPARDLGVPMGVLALVGAYLAASRWLDRGGLPMTVPDGQGDDVHHVL